MEKQKTIQKPKLSVDDVYATCLTAVEKWGYEKDDSAGWHLARLMTYVFTNGEFELNETEKEIWRKKKVLTEDGKIQVDEASDLKNPLFWIMTGLVWKGFVKVTREKGVYKVV